MEKIKQILKRWFVLPGWLAVLLSAAAGGTLVWVFLSGQETAWFAYPIYVLSFYTLTVDCAAVIPWAVCVGKRKQQTRAARDPRQQEREEKNSIYQNLLVDVAYGTVQIVQGVVQGSAWIGGNGIYHMGHAVAQAVLVGCDRKVTKVEEEVQRQVMAWKCYTLCGFALFGVNLAMTGLAFQMIWLNRSPVYSEIMVIAVAAFTFYKLTVAVIRVVQCRKSNSPITGAVRNMALTEALMTLFSLQTALFAVYGQDFQHKFLMNSLTGFAVCLSTMLGGLGMICHGRKRRKELKGERVNGTE